MEEQKDAFHPDNVQQVQLIVLMRIYDVLLAVLKEQNPEAAKEIYQYHDAGHIAGPVPYLLPLAED